MLAEEVEGTLLGREIETMRHVPYFRFEVLTSLLAIPYLVHLLESLLHSRHREQLILRTIDKEHRLRTCHTRYVRIIEPATKPRKTVVKAAILRSTIVE